MNLAMILAKSGRRLDVITLSGSDISFETGRAESLVAARLAHVDAAEAWRQLSGWSNGYVSFLPVDEGGRLISGVSDA